MKAKNEEFLYQLMWTCDQAARPTFRNLTDSFEQWAYRNGLSRQLAELTRRKLIEQEAAASQRRLDRAVRLTKAGRVQALGGRDPDVCWNRAWDGRWRLVMFDIPNDDSKTRDRLRRYLRQHEFGCLQQSVWITPHAVAKEEDLLADARIDVTSLILMEARPCAGETDEEIVLGAWDFKEINQRYAEHLKTLKTRPKTKLRDSSTTKRFHTWCKRELAAWKHAISIDPLLPSGLLPDGYLGQTAWKERLSAMRAAGKLMRNFLPQPE